MNPPGPPCSEKAITVAWRLSHRIYRGEEAAIRAFRRSEKGHTAGEARALVALAGTVLQEAIRLLAPKDEPTREAYVTRKPNGPDSGTRLRLKQELRANFPSCTDNALESAISWAVIYHIL